MDASDIERFLSVGHEVREFEVKGPGEFKDKAYRARVARAVIAMGNRRDGGLVCLGINDRQLRDMLPGLSYDQLAAWSVSDNVHDALAGYCDPPVAFEVVPLRLSSDTDVVVLEVEEFHDVPHICARDYQDILQKGALYVRPRGKPQSVPVPTARDMRDVLDLATTKGVRVLLRRLGSAGLVLPGPPDRQPSDDDAYAAECDRAWSSPSDALARIMSMAHFSVSVRPETYDPDRVPPGDLLGLLDRSTVRMRGWPLPMIDERDPLARHGTWIGQDLIARVVPHAEAWRMLCSGQFLARRVLISELEKAPQLLPTATEARGAVVVWDVLLYVVEVVELAARLALMLEASAMVVDVSLVGVEGRQLISGDWARDLDRNYVLSADTIGASRTITAAELISDPVGPAVAIVQRLLGQFGLSVPDSVLVDWQDQVLRRS